MVARVTESGGEGAERCEGAERREGESEGEGEGERKVELERGYGGKVAGQGRGEEEAVGDRVRRGESHG